MVFEKACETENPEYLIKLYTLSGDFYKELNQALAKDTNLGIGLKFDENFSQIHLYIGCLLKNQYLKKFRYSGTTYRGMRLNRKYFQTNYILHSGLPPHEVQKAENSSKNPEKSGKRNRKSGNLYFYEILRFLRVLTISFSICSISLFF
jgi:hypothetical protein